MPRREMCGAFTCPAFAAKNRLHRCQISMQSFASGNFGPPDHNKNAEVIGVFNFVSAGVEAEREIRHQGFARKIMCRWHIIICLHWRHISTSAPVGPKCRAVITFGPMGQKLSRHPVSYLNAVLNFRATGVEVRCAVNFCPSGTEVNLRYLQRFRLPQRTSLPLEGK